MNSYDKEGWCECCDQPEPCCDCLGPISTMEPMRKRLDWFIVGAFVLAWGSLFLLAYITK